MLKWLPEYYRWILTLILLVALTGLFVVVDESVCTTLLGIASIIFFISTLIDRWLSSIRSDSPDS